MVVRSRFEGHTQPEDEYLVKLAEVTLNSSSSDEGRTGGRIGTGRAAGGFCRRSIPKEFQLLDSSAGSRPFERNSSGASTISPQDYSGSNLSSPTSSISEHDHCLPVLLA